MKKKLSLILAGALFLGANLAYAQKKDKDYADVKIYENLTETQADSIRQCRKLEERMDWALKPQVNEWYDKRKMPFPGTTLDFFIKGEKKHIYLRCERLEEKLRILIGIGKENLHENLKLGNLEVYLIHSERTRFEIEQASIVLNRKERSVIYTDLEKNYCDDEAEFVVKESNGLITEILKYSGKLGKTLMIGVGKALIRRKFQIWAEEKDRVTEIGNEIAQSKVYVYPLELKEARNKFFSKREEKLRQIEINAGEKKILGVIVYYSLKKPNKYLPNLFDDESKMEYEAIKVYPLR